MPQAESEAERIFYEVRAIEGQAGRAAHIERACGGDAALRRRIEALLDAYEQAGEFLSRPEHAAATTEQAGQMIGRYKLLEQLGEGGFGSVWMAEQREPVKRRVALKVIKLGMDTKQVIARFEAERQALALMDHPHIAKVLDAGATETGRPFFVMELVRGVPILEYCDREKLDTARRLALFSSVCHAIQHAHQKGIIHRDIKPSNVLVTMHDGVPVPKVIDFGIAKATNSELTQKTLFTEHRQMIGTPAYMSPEQAEMSGLDIDTRADIYSLGVLLYELLTGTTPFDVKQLLSQGFAEMMRAIREDEPHKPSTRVSTLGDTATRTAQQRNVDARKLGLLLRGDLDWIVMKCLEKDRTRRYETANGLAADIQRHLDGEPVVAAPASRAYRVRKFVKRNRAAVIAGGTIALVLVAGIVGTSWGMLWAVAEKGRADLSAKAETTANAQAQVNATKALAEAQRAEDEAKHARTAEADAKQRASELEQVSKFQAGMLSQVDPTTAGVRLTADVKAKFEAALVKAGMSEAERAGEIEAFASQWRSVNATDAARELIDTTILKPAMVTIERDFKDQPLVNARLRQALADRYRELGLFDAALPLQEQALEIRRRSLGEKDRNTLNSIASMGQLLREQGRLDKAEPYLLDALDRSRSLLGEDDDLTLESINEMGILRFDQGRLNDAEQCCREVLERRRRIRGDEHLETLVAISNLGAVLLNQGKLTDAEPLLQELLDKYRRVLGEENPHTLNALQGMGALRLSQNRLGEAEQYFREGLEKTRQVRGEEHPDTLHSLLCLGSVLMHQNKLLEAEPVFREALDKCPRVLGNESLDSLVALNSWISLLNSLGRPAEAEPLLREFLAHARKQLAAEDPHLCSAIATLGFMLVKQGKLAEAEPILHECLKTHVAKQPDTWWTYNTLSQTGGLLAGQGKHEEADPLLIAGYEMMDPPAELAIRRREALERLVAHYRAWGELVQGKPAEVEPYLHRALEMSRRVLGVETPDSLAAINNIAFMLDTLGEPAGAEELLRELLPHARSQLAADDPNLAGALATLGSVLIQQRKFTEAEPVVRECLAIRTAKLPDTWFFYNTLSLLGASLAGQGKHEEANPLLIEAYEKMEPPAKWAIRKREALERLIEHYEAWGKPEEVARYKKLLETQPLPVGAGK